MHNSHAAETLKPTLKGMVNKFVGEPVALCYQCGKCTAGCPLGDEFDFAPNQILRMLQTGLPELEEQVLGSLAIWLCLTCQTCAARCPKDVNLPAIMDFLRSESLRRGLVNKKAYDILAFHKTFLDSVRLTGRLHEVGLIAGYKMRTFHLLQDVGVAPSMFAKGKLSIFPHKVKNTKALARIFSKTNVGKEE